MKSVWKGFVIESLAMAKKIPLPQITLTISFEMENTLKALLDSGFFGDGENVESVAEELLRGAIREVALKDLRWQIPRGRGL